MLDLARADAKRQRAKRTVRRGMRIAADDRHSRLRQALFRAENVDDSLLDAVEVVEFDAEFAAVFAQSFDLLSGDRIFEWQVAVDRRDGVVDGTECEFRPAKFSPREPQSFKSLRARHLVDQMQIDIEQRRLSGFFVDEMASQILS